MTGGGIPKPGGHLWPVPKHEPEAEIDVHEIYRCSNGTGGSWHYSTEPPAGSESPVPREIQNVLGAIPEPWFTWALAQFEDRMSRAEEGTLRFDYPEEEVGELLQPPLLEIRVQPAEEAQRAEDEYVLRLYFCEPDEVPDVFLALKFARKPSRGDPDGTQNRHIREARGRLERGARNGHLWGLTR